MDRLWIFAGSLAGLGAVGMAALGAHLFTGRLDPTALHLVDTAVQIEAWHALALILCGVWAGRGGVAVHVAGALFLAGVVLFCGALYAIAFAIPAGPAAPVGGLSLMAGWIALAASARRRT